MTAAKGIRTMEFGERYLVFPDLFPARSSGERWGEAELSLDLPGGPCVLRGLSTAQFEVLAPHYRPGGSGASEAPAQELEVSVFRAPQSDFIATETADSGATMPPELDAEAGGRAVRIAAARFMGRFEPGAATGLPSAALWTPIEHPPSDLIEIFESFLAVVDELRDARDS